MIKPNQHRITSLRLSDVFIVHMILSPPRVISKFLRLETLILDHIESKHLENVLQYAFSLPNLSALTINCVDYVENSTNIYHQIFRLCRLKYCQISGLTMSNFKLLPNVNNQYSSIEYLVIKNCVYFDYLDILLSYVPQLRHFSLNSLNGAFPGRTELSAIILNHLVHVSMDLHMIYFTQFEKIIEDSFYRLEVLRISTGRDVSYLNANRWEQLMLSHMQNLHLFEMNYRGSTYCDELSPDVLIKNFNSSFWIERKTIFICENNSRGNIGIKVFYSIDPSRYESIKSTYLHFFMFRKIHCRSFEIKDTHNGLFQSRININSIEHLHISSLKAMKNCENPFSNVTNLTFDHNFDTPYCSFTTDLSRIIPLVQIKTLVIQCCSIWFTRILEILRLTPHLHTLKYPSMSISDADCISIQQTENFQFISNTNNIKSLSINGQCSLENIKCLVTLCPKMETMKVAMDRKKMQLCLQFLLQKNKCEIFSLCISGVPKLCMKEVKKIIKSEKFLNNYLIQYIPRDLYLWY
jgi:hypothetical protein